MNFEEEFGKVWDEYHPKSINILTGRAGAIEYQRTWFKANNIPYTEEELLQRFKRNGTYKITSLGVEYVGLFDHNVPDGYRAIQSDEYFWVEKWKNGACVDYTEITKERFNSLKNETTY